MGGGTHPPRTLHYCLSFAILCYTVCSSTFEDPFGTEGVGALTFSRVATTFSSCPCSQSKGPCQDVNTSSGTGTLPQLGQEREEGGYNCHAGWSNKVVKRYFRLDRDWQVRGSNRNHAHSVCERERAFTGMLDTSPKMPAGRFDYG